MKRGEVVEVDWQFSDLTGSKMRPAVVVQADFLNGLIDDTILVKITEHALRHPRHGGAARPGRGDGVGPEQGLLASCKDILTRDQALILRTIGVLSDAAMRQIEDCLKTVLELP